MRIEEKVTLALRGWGNILWKQQILHVAGKSVLWLEIVSVFFQSKFKLKQVCRITADVLNSDVLINSGSDQQ